jgi:hypothetical protein
MGGETCNYSPPRSDCPTALKELQMFHWSYLNAGFQQDVVDSWRSQGCFNEIKQKLGYRFVLQSGFFSTLAIPGGEFSVRFTLRNEGWAAPYNRRDVELVLRNLTDGALYRFNLNVDPRRWLPGQTAVVEQTISLSADMPAGSYTVLLNLPDPMPSLRNRSEYAIQLANDDIWEADTGFNKLHHIVAIDPPR